MAKLSTTRPAASIPINQWRQMRHGQFFRGDEQKSLILNFKIQKCEFCAQIQINHLQFTVSEIGFGVSRTMEGCPSPKTPLLFAGASTP